MSWGIITGPEDTEAVTGALTAATEATAVDALTGTAATARAASSEC